MLGSAWTVGGATARVSASIGVHVATPADNPDHVLRAADHAMYAVKHSRSASRSDVAAPSGHG
jgi:GGDEF domain-containing protein